MRGRVFQRSPGKGKPWSYVVDVGLDANGKRRQQMKGGFRTKQEAEDGLAAVIAKLRQGEWVEPTRQTLGQYLTDEWLPALESGQTVKPTTVSFYEKNIRGYIVPRLGGVGLQKVDPPTLNAFYAGLLKDGKRNGKPLSPASVRRVHATLHRALRDAVKWRKLNGNPADFADVPRQRRPEMKFWTADEVRKFLAFTEDEPLHAAFVVLATTGMRRGEVLGLRWSDVDLDARRLSVRQTVVDNGPVLSFSEPKTTRGRRSLPLDGTTVAILRRHRKSQLEARLASGGDYRDDYDLVFAREDGSPVHPSRFSDLFERLVRRSGVSRIRLHDVRHTYAALSLAAGVPAKVVSERLGHSTVAFTLDTYAHVLPGLQEDAAERVAGVIFGTGAEGGGVGSL